jgi:hypothetical protein
VTAFTDEQTWKMLQRIAIALESVIDKEKGAVRTIDIGRAEVYKTHLGEKLRDDTPKS